MELTVTVFIQVCIMLLLIGVGILCYKKKLIDQNGKSQLSNFLLYIVIPAVILNAYQGEFNDELLNGLLWSFLLAFISHIVAIIVSTLIFWKKDSDGKTLLSRFCCIYSNCAFMAIPLVQALLGDAGVFYASAYITVFNLLTWTQGVFMLTGKADRKSVIGVLLSPTVLSVAAGLTLFFCRIPLPQIISEPIRYLAAVNTPLAMIITGVSIAQTSLLSCLKERKSYGVAAVKNLLIPIIMLIILRLLPLDSTVLLCNLIETACPTAAVSIMFAMKFRLDDLYASKTIALTTVLSVVTMPVIIFLFQLGR